MNILVKAFYGVLSVLLSSAAFAHVPSNGEIDSLNHVLTSSHHPFIWLTVILLTGILGAVIWKQLGSRR